MTFSEMFTDLKERITTESGSSFWSDTILKKWLNQANVWVAKKKSWRILQTAKYTVTVKDQNYYDLPEDYLYGTMFFVKINDIDYNYVNEVAFRNKDFNTNNTFTIHGKFYFVYPTPTEDNLVIDLYYQKRPTTLTNDSDTPELQDELHEAIISRALYVALKRDKRDSSAQLALQDAKDIIKDVWTMDKKTFRGTKTVGSILSSYSKYSASGNV